MVAVTKLENMNRIKKLEKYIKRYAGIEVKVYSIKWLWGGYGAYAKTSQNYIKICEYQLENDGLCYRPTIWHEMGHFFRASVW